MRGSTDIPPDLTNDDKAFIFQSIDANLNSRLLYALLHGIYTGILAVTLWNIFINKCWPIRGAMVAIIILLYTLITINFGASWSHTHSAFIESGQSFWAAYSNLYDFKAAYWEMCITASISTILADLYMIRCCWMVWGRRWLVILLPIISLTSAIASKIMVVYHDYVEGSVGIFPVLYISFSLATTLSCTLLIIYHIITVTGVRRGAEGRLRVYHRFIEVLVESSALYSITLILFLAFTIRGNLEQNYLDIVASIAKGVAPTLLLGRVVAGHTRPNDDHDESTVSTLQFRTPSEVGTTSLQESTMQSAVFEIDIEAQPERTDELVVVVEGTQ